MTMTTISSREFKQNVLGAKKAANSGPVFKTNRGKPAHVLLSFERYLQLAKQKRNIADALAMPGAADIDFQPGRALVFSKQADLS
ncbi:type II toxin-antitoxin system Phd/YefM family antitoxin [Advenella kashmirensis]